MKKRNKLIRKLMIQAIVVLAIGAFAFAGAWWLGDYTKLYQEDRDKETTKLTALYDETIGLRDKSGRYHEAVKTVDALGYKDGKNALQLSRDNAMEVLEQLKHDYAFEQMRVTIEPIKELNEERYKKPAAQGLKSTIKMTLNTYSDELISEFLEELPSALPGLVHVYHVKMTRGSPKQFSPDATPQDVSTFPLTQSAEIEVEIHASWYGLRLNKNLENSSDELVPVGAAQGG